MTAIELKRNLRDQERQKYGKWAGIDPSKFYLPIENQADIDALRAAMADGNYPVSIPDCYVVGINGDCGPNCPVFLRGECTVKEGEND
ncbi:MAG: hypothetical protein WC824_15960 [Bacteroidota bacterium]|jgi:hypothetical protein